MNRERVSDGMCDCYEEEFEGATLETSEPVPVAVPLQVSKSRRK
jgi:hypothetical protein